LESLAGLDLWGLFAGVLALVRVVNGDVVCGLVELRGGLDEALFVFGDGEFAEGVDGRVFFEAGEFGGWGLTGGVVVFGGAIEFFDGPFFEGLAVMFGGCGMGAEFGEADFEAEDLGDGIELLLTLGFGSDVVLHEATDQGQFVGGYFLRAR